MGNINPDFRLWPLNNNTNIDRELYTGELFKCYSDKAVYKKGEEIKVGFDNNSGKDVYYGMGYNLDILINNQWYSINENWGVPTVAIKAPEGSGGGWVINEKTFTLPSTYYYDEVNDRYEADSRERVVVLPEGHYRLVATITTDDIGVYYTLHWDVNLKLLNSIT